MCPKVFRTLEERRLLKYKLLNPCLNKLLCETPIAIWKLKKLHLQIQASLICKCSFLVSDRVRTCLPAGRFKPAVLRAETCLQEDLMHYSFPKYGTRNVNYLISVLKIPYPHQI